MEFETDREQELEQRLEALEAAHNGLKRGLAFGLAVLGAGLVGPLLFYVWSMSRYSPGAGGGVELGTIVRAHRFVLADGEGKELAALGVDEGRPGLSVYDDQGNPRASFDEAGLALWGAYGEASLAAGADGLRISDERGRERIALGMDDGEPHLALMDSGPHPVARLAAGVGGPRLELAGSDGRPRAFLGADVATTNLALLDDQGQERAGIGVTANGAHLRMRDGKEAIRTILRSGSDGGTGLDFYDDEDQPRMIMGVGRDGSPTLDFMSADTLRLPDQIRGLLPAAP